MAEAWEPTPAEIHALIPQRAAGRDFDASTIPTLTQVQTITANTITDLTTFVGEEIEEDHHALAKLAAAYGTAAAIELALFPEQARREGSTYEVLTALYVDYRNRLSKVVGDGASVPGDAGNGPYGAPSGHFPTPVPGNRDEGFTPLGSMGF